MRSSPVRSRATLALALMPIALTAAALPARAQGPRPSAATIARAVDSLAQRAIAIGAGPALGVAIAMDGRVILARGYGLADANAGIPADEHTLWYVASTSKSFTGVAAALLADEGHLSFDAPITTLLPSARWHADVRPSELTLADFLGHTMGIASGAVVTQAAFVGQINEREWPTLLQWSPPLPTRDLIYSNLGYNVAAMVIDRLRPEGWRAFTEQRLFLPSGMRDTHARVSGLDPRRIARPHALHADGTHTTVSFYKVDATMNSAGGHLATIGDLARWTIVQMDSGRIDGEQAIPASAVARAQVQLRAHTRDQSRRFAYFDRAGWGAGWDLGTYEGEPMVSRFGSYHSTRSHLSFLPRRRIGVVVETNGEAGGAMTDIIAALVYDLEAGRADARERAERRFEEYRARFAAGLRSIAAGDSTRAARQRQPLPRGWAAYAGTFEHPGHGTVSFTLAGDGLRFEWGAVHGPVEIFDAAQDAMRIEVAGGGTVVRFAFGADGRAERVVINGVEFGRR